LYEPDWHQTQGYCSDELVDELVFEQCLSDGKSAKDCFCIFGDFTSFFLRLEFGKWRVGLPGSKYFWSYPLPSIEAAPGFHVIVIPYSSIVVGGCLDARGRSWGEWVFDTLCRRYEKLAVEKPFFSDALAEHYESTCRRNTINLGSVELRTSFLPSAGKKDAENMWSALGCFASWYASSFVVALPAPMLYRDLLVFAEQLKGILAPAELELFGRPPLKCSALLKLSSTGSSTLGALRLGALCESDGEDDSEDEGTSVEDVDSPAAISQLPSASVLVVPFKLPGAVQQEAPLAAVQGEKKTVRQESLKRKR